MSGGSFDYNCFRISQFADDLEARISEIELDTEEYYIENKDKMLSAFKDSLKVIRLAGRLAHHIEWFFSGDHGEESFLKLYNRDIYRGERK